MRRIHVPNLFILVGQPDNGKTTLAKCFKEVLDCEVMHTDQIYLEWVGSNYPGQLRSAKHNIRGHYPRQSEQFRQSWNEYLTTKIIDAIKRSTLDLVAEGWLLLYLPVNLKEKIDRLATSMTIHMRRFQASANGKSVKPAGRDYTGVVRSLVKQMVFYKGISFMRNLVRYQSFEDIRDYQGTSDSCGKLLALRLPEDMSGKSVLDVGCGTGYFSIRCRQRGARVRGIDVRSGHIRTASRIANSIYRLPDIKFHVCNFTKFDRAEKFDYILAVTVLPCFGNKLDAFFDKAFNMLKPGGLLVVETVTSAATQSHEYHGMPFVEHSKSLDPKTNMRFAYYSDEAIKYEARKFDLVFEGRSIRLRGDKRRYVYHFRRPLVTADYSKDDTYATDTHSEPVLHYGTAPSREEYTSEALQTVS